MRIISIISWRIIAIMGCCARGIVPQAPSHSGGMYVTGDDMDAFALLLLLLLLLPMGAMGVIVGAEPMFGEARGDEVREKIRGMT